MEPTNTPTTGTTTRPRLHPLVATAAIAVIVLSAVGVTAFVTSRSNATPSPYDAPPPAALANAATPAAAQPATAVAPSPAPLAPTSTSVAPPAPTASAPVTPNYGPPAPPAAPVYEAPPPVAQAAPACRDCGVVASINEYKVQGQGTGVGAVGGAVVGGLLGNMVGSGRGKALATVAGAVGGGFGGNAIEKNVRSEVEHRMVVRLDNGRTRTFTQASPFPYHEGERVRVVNGHVERG